MIRICDRCLFIKHRQGLIIRFHVIKRFHLSIIRFYAVKHRHVLFNTLSDRAPAPAPEGGRRSPLKGWGSPPDGAIVTVVVIVTVTVTAVVIGNGNSNSNSNSNSDSNSNSTSNSNSNSNR